MTTVPELDFADPLVRAMADRNHDSQESWSRGGALIGVTCGGCNNPWPCPTRVTLRALDSAVPKGN